MGRCYLLPHVTASYSLGMYVSNLYNYLDDRFSVPRDHFKFELFLHQEHIAIYLMISNAAPKGVMERLEMCAHSHVSQHKGTVPP